MSFKRLKEQNEATLEEVSMKCVVKEFHLALAGLGKVHNSLFSNCP